MSSIGGQADVLADREVSIAHSPDSDDAFMFYGLATGKVRSPGLRFTHTLCDIETLNRRALEAFYDVTAISFHAYPYIQEEYALLGCGGSVGEGYGPMVVSTRPLSPDQLTRVTIAVPGTLTTAYLALKLFEPHVETEVVPFDQIIPQVKAGQFDAGLIIHEGQLTFGKSGMQKVLDLGEWWLLETGLPLPLGVNVARRDLGEETLHELSEVLRESIQAGLANRRRAMAYAMQFGRGLDEDLTDRFVGMYVNDFTCDYGDEGRQAVRELLRRAEAIGAYEQPVRLDFVA
jgi:1,4-dihydroxy-6-naphthoate synthase